MFIFYCGPQYVAKYTLFGWKISDQNITKMNMDNIDDEICK